MNAAEVGAAHPSMNTAPWSLKTTLGALTRGWQRFFHEPCDARIPAAIRIVYAAIVLIHLAVLYPDLDMWFTASGVLPVEAALKIVSPYSWSLFALLPDTSAAVHVCFWIAVSHAVCLLVGFLPRVNALLLFVWIVSFQVRNNLINDGEDCLMRLMGFFVIWLPSGRCWSVNAVIGRWWKGGQGTGDRGQESEVGGQRSEVRCLAPGWPLRLFQIEMAAMFFSS